jgi:predicted  nucleic acid-binding Zn-ribbon protein
MTVAADLFALQETDMALDSALPRLQEIESQLGETEELTSARGWLEAAIEYLRQLKSTQSDLEFEADDVRAKVAAVEAKLYGGEVTDSRELADLDADLKSIKSNLQTREDALLASLERTEEGEAAAAQAQATLSDIEARWKAAQALLQAEKVDLEPEIERLRAIREEQSAAADRASLSLYDILRDRRDGSAVATVERGMCQGCRITLPRNIIQKARNPGALVQCVSCERILVFV